MTENSSLVDVFTSSGASEIDPSDLAILLGQAESTGRDGRVDTYYKAFNLVPEQDLITGRIKKIGGPIGRRTSGRKP